MLASVGAAIYSLILYLYNFQTDITQYSPFWKFFSIKIALFLSIWQKIALKVIKIDDWFKLDSGKSGGLSSSDYIDNLLIVIEMLILALICNKCYGYEEYQRDVIAGVGRKSQEISLPEYCKKKIFFFKFLKIFFFC